MDHSNILYNLQQEIITNIVSSTVDNANKIKPVYTNTITITNNIVKPSSTPVYWCLHPDCLCSYDPFNNKYEVEMHMIEEHNESYSYE